MNPFHQSFSTRSVWVGNDICRGGSIGVGGWGKKKGGPDEVQGDETRGSMWNLG